MGIICDDFELLLKKNKYILDGLNDIFTDISKINDMFNSNIYSPDLKFLMNKLGPQLSHLDIVEKKIGGYQKTLNSIYDSYNQQAAQIVRDISNLIP